MCKLACKAPECSNFGVQFFIVHLVACFWFLSTTFETSPWDTWIAGRNLIGASNGYTYFNAFYWAFQTSTTVGYGDFAVTTKLEYILAIIWMVIGTNLFTLTVGSVSTMIGALDDEIRARD